nr:katanin P80 WD40 repeat-containing subunit B1 homolog isoform X1 [Ipomoea batatas]
MGFHLLKVFHHQGYAPKPSHLRQPSNNFDMEKTIETELAENVPKGKNDSRHWKRKKKYTPKRKDKEKQVQLHQKRRTKTKGRFQLSLLDDAKILEKEGSDCGFPDGGGWRPLSDGVAASGQNNDGDILSP